MGWLLWGYNPSLFFKQAWCGSIAMYRMHLTSTAPQPCMCSALALSSNRRHSATYTAVPTFTGYDTVQACFTTPSQCLLH